MDDQSASRRLFSAEFNDRFPVGPHEGNDAFFGMDVLRGLVSGIDDFIKLREPRWRRFRSLGSALLGSAMWIDDEELVGKLGELSAACVVVTKQRRRQSDLSKLAPLQALNERTPGMTVRAFSALTDLAPRSDDGGPAVVGPYSPEYGGRIATIRTLGFRKLPGPLESSPPIIHAKLALLGHLWWHDEDEFGIADVTGFQPQRLWISSANFTRSSRRSLEFGYWTEDLALMRGAERFLVKLMGSSEDLDPDADSFEPDLMPVEYDDAAMAEAYGQMREEEEEGSP